jgi:hypothetical protein
MTFLKTMALSATLSLALGAVFTGPASAGEAADGLDPLLALAGDWKGTGPHGEASATYEVFSNGSAVVETLRPHGEVTMVTVYHLDGKDLRLTHYCAAQNQPRMKAPGVDPAAKSVTFEFVDVTNVSSPDEGHMGGLELTFVDSDHLRQRWTWFEGSEKKDSVFELARVK